MTKQRLDRNDWLTLALVLGMTLLTWALYAELPARIPIHFDVLGRPNGWASRAVGAWLLPAFSVGMWGFLRVSNRLVPEGWRARLTATPRGAVALLVTALFAALQVVILYAALHAGVAVGRALLGICGATWIALGQILPRVRRNPFIGVRTPWTLTSDENWLRTHRFAAYTFVVGGVVAVVGALAGGAVGAGIGATALVASALGPLVYSYVHAVRTG